MSTTEELYTIADELRATASLGLHFEENPYGVERYERVLSLSARLVAAIEQRSPDEVLDVYRGNLGHISPIAGAEAAVLRDGNLLLIRREDDGLWALPGGLTDVGETLAESAERELREEAGVQGPATKLLGIFDSRRWDSRTRFQTDHVVFLVEAGEGTPVAGPETTDVGFFSEDSLPMLSPGHHRRAPFVFKLLRDEVPTPYFDSAAKADGAAPT